MTFQKLLVAIVLVLACVRLSLSQGNANPCTPQVTCSACITAGGDCAWCADDNFKAQDKQRPRCDFLSSLEKLSCRNLTSPTSGAKVPPDGDVTLGESVQISPKKIDLNLRPGKGSSFKINIRPAENYPVDLYYLMDLSNSMADDLENLKLLGTQIASTIGNITTNYRLGFGSFVEKTVSPYIQIEFALPCSGCRATFGYQHVLNFTTDAQLFQNEIKKQNISGNLDMPEGGFDAMMQIAVCGSRLDWRPTTAARRIVIYVSDATFHVAGDGKLGGITIPNDGQCHLSPINMYSMTNKLDYPSVGFLKDRMKENKIVPIIAVTKEVQDIYQNLATQWRDLGATTGILASDSSNVVGLIREAYKKITSTIRLTDDSKSYIQVDYTTSNCGSGSSNECVDVAIGDTVTFDVKVTASAGACEAAAKNEDKQFQISIPGFGDVLVNVNVTCDCDCETGPLSEPNSDKCHFGNGTFACGQCYCNPERFGDTCSCTSEKSADETLCRVNRNNTDEPVCSGFGTCICGKCECIKRQNPEEIISGSFCQCNNFGCQRHEGLICGGPGRGRCECGKCVCEGLYIGENCGKRNCTKVEPQCMHNGELCGGHGTCDCGVCNCDPGYKGSRCEDCPTCPGQCLAKKDCIICQAFDKGDPNICANCTLNVEVVNGTVEEKCRFQDDDGCFFVFTYEENDAGNMTYRVQQNKKCYAVVVEEANVLAIVLGTIGGIVLFGLIALLLWKLLISAYDNYEYHKFEKERSKSKWEKAENPLYKPSKQKYENPTFTGSRR